MVRPCRHSRCHLGGAALAITERSEPYLEEIPLLQRPLACSLHPLGMRVVATSVGESAAPGRIGKVIELHDKRVADNAPPYISIIIPARNDAEVLTRTLDHLDRLSGIESAEVFVAAAGDRQSTSLAVAGRAQLLWPDGSTRAILMNAGAARARAEVLWFLHADSLPPVQALKLIMQALLPKRVVGGAFAHRFAESVWSLHVINWINRLRYRLTHNYYGDQGLFVRTAVFRQMGGYRPLQVMEDLDFSQRLKRIGQTTLIREPLRTSGRRFLARGPWRTFLFIVWLLLLHTLRFDTQRYAERWRGPAHRPPGSPWPHRHPHEAGGTAREGDC
jgi:rSAM/selenodomain-associated transferase 2